jgi:hypothetical protein
MHAEVPAATDLTSTLPGFGEADMKRSRGTRRTSDWVCDEALETAARYVGGVRSATGASRARALLSRPGLAAVVEVLRSVPVVEAPFSAGPAGTALRAAFAMRRGLFLSRVPVALLRLPATHAEYLRGRPRQALRTNVNRATAMGITCSRLTDPADLQAAIDLVAARRDQDPATMIRPDTGQGIARRFIVARDAAGEPVGISETVIDGRWAGLAMQVTVPSDEGTGLDGQVLRYLLQAETVRDLIDQGVQSLVVSGSMLLSPAGTRYFQRRTGYEPVWLRPVRARGATAAPRAEPVTVARVTVDAQAPAPEPART